jgi:drug/metabolite transporter (DMT)-like permease
MKLGRTTTLALVALDFFAAVAVFNLANHFRFIGAPGHFILGGLAGPVAAILFAIYLIEGYSVRTDMLSVNYTSQHSLALLGAGTATLLVTFALLPPGFELQSSRIVISISFIALIPLTLAHRRLIYPATLKARGNSKHDLPR